VASQAFQPPAEGRTPPQVAPHVKRRRRRTVTLFMCALVVFIFCAKIANYAFPEAIRLPSIESWISGREEGVRDWYDTQPRFHTAPQGQRMAVVPGGFVYTSGPDNTVWTHIFNTSPLRAPGGKPTIYAAIANGSVAAADSALSGQPVIPRYKPVAVSGADMWRADPYKSVYWRFYYYSLRPTVNLLAAYQTTHDRKYIDALLAIDRSFFKAESTSPYAWQDNHAVAFRAIVLAYEWWELRRLHLLSVPDSTAFLQELAKTGEWLKDPNHYQPQMNHGTNESAALLQLAVDFPSLPQAASWLHTARTRLTQSLDLLIDRDGVLIENSPYYHFYELDKFWQIYKFSCATAVPVAPGFASRLQDMIEYATYVLQPNGQIPLLGASLAQTINMHGTFAEMAKEYEAFRYVLTQGREASPPEHTSVTFPESGLTVFRSGWGRESSFVDASYATFNVGAYRTPHSSLDALGFTLCSNGASLLPGPGLYTYAPGPMRDYFHGTASHNTVVVDGQSQSEGSASAGPLVSRNGVVYQSGFSALYEGVAHSRTLMMLDKNHFLVVDRLTSSSAHTYQQMFHLFPGATLTRTGLTVRGEAGASAQSVAIQQLDSTGVTVGLAIGRTNPPMGLHSARYQEYEPNYAVSYTQSGLSAAFTTLISIGPPDSGFSIAFDKPHQQLSVNNHGRVLRIDLRVSSGSASQVDVRNLQPTVPSAETIPGLERWSQWSASGDGISRVVRSADGEDQGEALWLSAAAGKEEAANDLVRADLSGANLHIRIKCANRERLAGVSLELSNHHWLSRRRIDLGTSVSADDDGAWMTISLGRDSSLSGQYGHWDTEGGPFDWGRIDGFRISMSAHAGHGPPPSLEIASIRTVHQQRRGAVVICFDDGYESIKPAATYMRENGMPGNVAVIGRSVQLPSAGYLNRFDLRMLQDSWGWNMVNHTQRHVNLEQDYYSRNRLGAFRQDIVDGALTLERAGLNSAPNWFIYPHGSTNATLSKVVGRFYKFARTTYASPEAYPFGSPLCVRTLELSNAVSSGGSITIETPPEDVISAVRDAARYRTPLILTFHRIEALPSDRPGYPIKEFREIIDAIRRTGIPVLTFSQLDVRNGVLDKNAMVYRPGAPPMTTVAVTDVSPHRSFWSWLSALM